MPSALTDLTPDLNQESRPQGTQPPRLALAPRSWSASLWHALRHGTSLQVALATLAVTGCILTFLAMSGRIEALGAPRVILFLLMADLVLLLALMFVVLRRAVRLWQERKGDEVGRRLHLKFLSLFGLVAATPTLIISVFSLLIVVLGLQDWLGTRVRDALGSSLTVANAYLAEHREGVAADISSMSDGLLRAGLGAGVRTTDEIRLLMERQIEVLRLDEAVLFFTSAPKGTDSNTDAEVIVVSRVGALPQTAGEAKTEDISDWAARQAQSGEIIILQDDRSDRVRALRYLGSGEEDGAALSYYLAVTRLVDGQVLQHMEATSFAVSLYERLEGQRTGFIVTFTAIFVILSLLLFLSALVVGISFANRLNRPLAALIQAADSLEQGALDARVPEAEERGEIGVVSRTFNRMASGLARQRRELLETNRALEDRRAFIEAVLGGVSSGVIALDAEGRVRMLNQAAEQFFAVPRTRVLGRRAAAFSRELRRLLALARAHPGAATGAGIGKVESQTLVFERQGQTRTYRVRVAARRDSAGDLSGYVITLDDLTESLSAERKAAWADVARAIAHEIKNPLTPIQLSVERLLRNFSDDTDGAHSKRNSARVRESVDTVTHQVREIRKLVDAFSDFARMPEPSFEVLRLDVLVGEVADLYAPELARLTAGHCRLELKDLPAAEVLGDDGQLRRAILNLVKNAALSIAERQEREGTEATAQADGVGVQAGEILLSLTFDTDTPDSGSFDADTDLATDSATAEETAHAKTTENPKTGTWRLVISDNGTGLPEIPGARLTEPYVTTRASGSGLGLAIVRKIAEVHGGRFLLRPRAEGTDGAEAVLWLPARPSTPQAKG